MAESKRKGAALTGTRYTKTISTSTGLGVVLGLTALCAAQPVLEIVARNAVFLTVHGLEGFEIAVLPALLIVVVGGLLWLPVLVAGRLGGRAGNAMLAGAACLLVAMGLRPLIGRLLPVSGAIQLTAALVIAGVTVALAGRSPRLRPHLAMLGWSVPLIILAFLLGPQVRPLLAGHTADGVWRDVPPPDDGPPIVMIVFDAFPTVSIMAGDGGIDPVLCPNLAGLAQDAVWFRNAVGQSDDTLWAVPSILTAVDPEPGSQPTYRSHPANLMTWLRPYRPVHAFESHTRLDPLAARPDLLPRWRLTLADLAVIAGHVHLPADLAAGLPPLSHDWKNFAGEHGDDSIDPTEREGLMEGFLASLATEQPNSCWVLHALVPHTPYSYLPSGRHYAHGGVEPGGEGLQWGLWSEDQTAVVQSQQRHLLQVGYADAFVGRVLDTLRRRGLYEDAVVVVTADHGVSFRRGDARRQLSATNAGAILGVPLLIKTPGTGRGRIDTRLARSVDILPTIAGALGTQLAWPADGRDLLEAGRKTAPDSVVIVGKTHDLVLAVEDVRAQRRDAVARKLRRFGEAPGLPGLFAPLRGVDLLGTAPEGLPAPPHLAVGLEGPADLVVAADPGQPLPAEVKGFASSPESWPTDWDVAVTVDGVIAAVTRPRRKDAHGGFAPWATLLPEAVLTPGPHTLGTLLVHWQENVATCHETGACTLEVLGVDLLQANLPGLVRAGLHGIAPWDGRPARWTDGHGVIDLATVGRARPGALDVEVYAAGPDGGDLVVTANGLPLATIPLTDKSWCERLDLQGIDPGDGLVLEFFSPFFVPVESGAGSTDTRRLGVVLGSVTLADPAVDGLPPLPRPEALALYPHDPGPWALGGFERAEPWGQGMAAWTNGAAEARIDLSAAAIPRYLLLDLAATGPHGASLDVRVDGQSVLNEDLPVGPWSGCVALPMSGPRAAIELALDSTTFVPALEDTLAADRRRLGVAVRWLYLVF